METEVDAIAIRLVVGRQGFQGQAKGGAGRSEGDERKAVQEEVIPFQCLLFAARLFKQTSLVDANVSSTINCLHTRNGEDEHSILNLSDHLLRVRVDGHLNHLLKETVASSSNKINIFVRNHLLLSLSFDTDHVALHLNIDTVLRDSRDIADNDKLRIRLVYQSISFNPNFNDIDAHMISICCIILTNRKEDP